MDYISAIRKFIDPIVVNNDKVEITELPNENPKDRTFLIKCEKDDAGRLIGKKGSTADALREVLSVGCHRRAVGACASLPTQMLHCM